MKRPISVWLVQLLFALTLLIIVPALVLGVARAAPHLSRLGNAPFQLAILLADFMLKAGLASFLVLASLAIAKRRRSGRWMGLVGIGAIFVLWVFVQVSTELSDPLLPTQSYDNTAEKGGATIAAMLWILGLAFLFRRFGFSQESRAFFSESNDS